MNFEENNDHLALTTGSVCMISSNWKLVRFFGPLRYPDMPVLHDLVYDLRSDPNERRDLASALPDMASSMAAEIDRSLHAQVDIAHN
jgi:arylsulfatase A-like enzyme